MLKVALLLGGPVAAKRAQVGLFQVFVVTAAVVLSAQILFVFDFSLCRIVRFWFRCQYG